MFGIKKIEFFSSKSLFKKWKFWNFEKRSEHFQNFDFFFSISNFENGFSSWKINIFHPKIFLVQSMNGYYRFRTSTLLHNAYGRMVPKKTTQTPWFRSYRDLFANGFICKIYEGSYLRNPLREGYLKLNFSIEKSYFLVRKCYSIDYNFLSSQYFFMKLFLKERAWSLFFKTSKNIENGSIDKKRHPVEF